MRSATVPAVLLLDELCRAHLHAALHAHRARLGRDYRTLPAALEDLLHALGTTGTVQSRQQVSPLDLLDADPHSDAVLVDLATAARYLSVGVRTVERLVTAGDLRSVQVGRSRRIHRDDLDTYLRAQRGLAPREDDLMPSKARAQRARQQLDTFRTTLSDLRREYAAAQQTAGNYIDPNLSIEGLRNRRRELEQAGREALGERVEDIRSGLGTDVQVLVDYATQVRPTMTADSVRQGRLWDRTRTLLDSGRTLDVVLRSIDDTDTLLVLHDELPSWIRAQADAPRGLDGAGWDEPDVEQALLLVDARLAEVAGGDVREAMLWAREAAALQAELTPMLDHLELVANNASTDSGGLQAAIAGRIESRRLNPASAAS